MMMTTLVYFSLLPGKVLSALRTYQPFLQPIFFFCSYGYYHCCCSCRYVLCSCHCHFCCWCCSLCYYSHSSSTGKNCQAPPEECTKFVLTFLRELYLWIEHVSPWFICASCLFSTSTAQSCRNTSYFEKGEEFVEVVCAMPIFLNAVGAAAAGSRSREMADKYL